MLANWDEIKATIIADLDVFGVYPGGHFSNTRFLECVEDELGIPLAPRCLRTSEAGQGNL